MPNVPKLPPELHSGSMRSYQARQAERVRLMEEAYGVKFSRSGTNPLGVREAKRLGVPGAGFPRAIWPRGQEPLDDPAAEAKVVAAVRKWGPPSGYVTYTTIALATDLPFPVVFGVIRKLQLADPRSVRMTVDRMGENTAVRLL